MLNISSVKKIIKKYVLAVGLMTMFFSAVGAVEFSSTAAAEIIEQTVEAFGEYRIGDNDTRAQAKNLALTEAKRVAAEKVLVYVESNTNIENFEAVKDSIETYTKAKMQILQQKYSFLGEEGTLCQAYILAHVEIDMDEIRRQQALELQRRQEEEQRQREEQERMERERQQEEERQRRETQNKNNDILQTIISAILDRVKF